MRKPKALTDRILAVAFGWTPVPKTTTWGRGRWQDQRGNIHPDIPMFTVSPTDIIRELIDQKVHFSVRGPLEDATPFKGLFHAEVTRKAGDFYVFVSNEETPALALCRSAYNYAKHHSK